jgi:hypothetical protein
LFLEALFLDHICYKIPQLTIMTYTFQISDNTPQSQSIINMLISLAEDYDFLKIIKKKEESEEFELTAEQEAELDRRFENFQKNAQHGKPWNEVK